MLPTPIIFPPIIVEDSVGVMDWGVDIESLLPALALLVPDASPLDALAWPSGGVCVPPAPGVCDPVPVGDALLPAGELNPPDCGRFPARLDAGVPSPGDDGNFKLCGGFRLPISCPDGPT